MFKKFREQHELMEDKIKLGIESHRKGYFKICFTDGEGNPVRGARLKIRQKTHEFRFGANLFKLGCFASDEENALYEERFSNLFNMATLPFYWSDFDTYPIFENIDNIPEIRLPVRTEKSTMEEILTSLIEAITCYFAWICNEISESYIPNEEEVEEILQEYLKVE